MTHEDVRAAISADEITDEVREHLEGCAACSAWSARLEDIRRVAADAIPDTPSDLAERVVKAVRAEAAVVATLTPLTGRSLWKTVRFRMVAAAALALIVAASTVLVTKTGASTPGQQLVAAAKKSQAAESVGFMMTARFRVELAKPLELPQQEAPDMFRGLPESIRPRVEWKPMGPERIDVISTELFGSGQGVPPERWRHSGMLTTKTEPSLPMLFMPQRVESVAVGDRAWVRSPSTKEKWIAIEDAPVTMGVDPGRFLRLATTAYDAEDLGEEDEDGTMLRRYRFTADENLTVDAWVGENGYLYRLEIDIARAEVPAGVASGHVGVTFVNYGGKVKIDAPKAKDVISADEVDHTFPFLAVAMLGSFRVTFPEPTFMMPTIRPMPNFSRPPRPDFSFEPQPSPPTWPTPTPREEPDDWWSPTPYPEPGEEE